MRLALLGFALRSRFGGIVGYVVSEIHMLVLLRL